MNNKYLQPVHQTVQCLCGKVQLNIASPAALRLVCYCKDCRGYYNTLNHNLNNNDTAAEAASSQRPPLPALLDPWGGCDYTQIYPSEIQVADSTRATQHVAVTKIRTHSPIHRYYCDSCYTPLFQVGPSGAALLNTNLLQADHKPPVRFRIVGRDALPVANKGYDEKEVQERPRMSWSVPLSWFWTMPRRIPNKADATLPANLLPNKDGDDADVPVLANFRPG